MTTIHLSNFYNRKEIFGIAKINNQENFNIKNLILYTVYREWRFIKSRKNVFGSGVRCEKSGKNGGFIKAAGIIDASRIVG